MANNHLHPVHQSNLVKNLRITLMPHIRQSEWRAVLKNLRDYHDKKVRDRGRIDLTQDSLAAAFVWSDTPQNNNYWGRLDRISRGLPPFPLAY